MTVTCPCCGYVTLTGSHDICGICGWEHDIAQQNDPYDQIGANAVTLRQAQANFAAFGAKGESSKPYCRNPGPADRKDPEWRRFLQPGDYNTLGLRNLVSDASTTAWLRIDAVRMLGDVADANSLDLVAGLLNDRDPAMVDAAVYALGGIPDERARLLLRGLLTQRHYLEFHWDALLDAVRRQEDPVAVPLVVQAAQRLDSFHRQLVAFVLCRMGTKESCLGAREVFDSIKSERHRRTAATEMKALLTEAAVGASAERRREIDAVLGHIAPWLARSDGS